MGRRPTYTDPAKIKAEVCERISKGETLAEICRTPGMPERTLIYRWQQEDSEFEQQFAHARLVGFDAIADEALEIANTPLEGIEIEDTETGRKVKRADMLGHRKLQVETRLKLLAKWDPRRYGERTAVEHSGRIGLEDLVSDK